MRLATWNVNSVRARLDRITEWLETSGTDVLALQEVKCTPTQFPREAFEAAGYEVAVHGLDQWNGVAIASRIGLTDVEENFAGQPAFGKPGKDPVVEARALGATCGGVRVWSLYVPNGRALADPHYTYKVEFLARLRDAAAGWAAAEDPVALLGDWNVAPFDTDLWSLEDEVAETHATPDVRDAFFALEDAGYEEQSRRFLPEPHTYTFWDYQQLRFPRNEGLRIDFAYATGALAERVTAVTIDRAARKGTGASDHVPVVLEIADAAGTV